MEGHESRGKGQLVDSEAELGGEGGKLGEGGGFGVHRVVKNYGVRVTFSSYVRRVPLWLVAGPSFHHQTLKKK